MKHVSTDAPWRGQGDIIRTRHSESGKGDRQRPMSSSEKELAESYCRMFGHRRRRSTSTQCMCCGSLLEASQGTKAD